MNFIGDARTDEHVDHMYATDLRVQGYVANQTRLWAHSPESMAALTYALSMAVESAGLDVRQRALLVTTTAAAMGDAYCALAFGYKLANAAGEAAAVRAVTGDDTGLDDADRALVRGRGGWSATEPHRGRGRRRARRRPGSTTGRSWPSPDLLPWSGVLDRQ